MIWTKGTHQSAKFQTFDCSRQISPNLYFDRFLWLKVYKIPAKRSIEELCLMSLNINAEFVEKLIFCFKNDKNLVNLAWALKILKTSTLVGFFCAKYMTFDLKKYRGVIFPDTEESCKIWRKTDLWFGKLHEESDKFSPEHLKVSKLESKNPK